MSPLSAREVGTKLVQAGRMKLRPVCIYAAETVPSGVVTPGDVVKAGNRCLVKSMLLVAAGAADGVYVAREPMKGSCPGSLSFLGMVPFPPKINEQLSTVGKAAMYLKASPECAGRTLKAVEQITFPGKFLVMQACDKAADVKPLAYTCFGKAEEIRNLCGLVHFSSNSPFGQIDAAWGSGCETFITYPAGMVAGAPKDTAFIGPCAPDENKVLPPDMMILAIPAKIADRMAEDLARSFVVNAPASTYPSERDAEVLKALGSRF